VLISPLEFEDPPRWLERVPTIVETPLLLDEVVVVDATAADPFKE